MGRRLDFEQAFRKYQARNGLSVKDEGAWMKNDVAARWLRRNGSDTSQHADHCPSARQPSSSGMKLHRRKKHRDADLDPDDPHDQLSGLDMKRIPWA